MKGALRVDRGAPFAFGEGALPPPAAPAPRDT
jgi:hypothetical protein